MSNPFRHGLFHFSPALGRYVARPGEDLAEDVATTWSSALAEAGHCLDEIDNCAARVRHGARAACKRLRAERDVAREDVRREREVSAGLGADLDQIRRIVGAYFAEPTLEGVREYVSRATQLEQERDHLSEELRALEWLVVKGYPHWISCDDTTRIVHGHTGPDWQTVARALGWEG